MESLISHTVVAQNDQLAEVTTYQEAMSLRIHAMGFLEIASVAARVALENKTAIDSITPSIIYAIRHATELFLKHLIVELGERYDPPVQTPSGHILQELLADNRASIEEILNYEAHHDEHTNFDHKQWLDEFTDIINQVHQVDPDGQTLRYPTNTKGVPHLGGKMVVSVAQLERFAHHAAECFSRFSARSF